MKGGDQLPVRGEFVVYNFNGRNLIGVSAGATDPSNGMISVYIPENDNFEEKEFLIDVRRLSPLQEISFASKIRRIKQSNRFAELFGLSAVGGRTRKRKNKNKRTRKR